MVQALKDGGFVFQPIDAVGNARIEHFEHDRGSRLEVERAIGSREPPRTDASHDLIAAIE